MFEIEAKKSLGQNFLKNTSTIEKIVDAGDIQAGDYVLEIGPGTGAMTEKILEKIHQAGGGTDGKSTKQAKLLVIEKDARAIPVLEAKFKDEIESGLLTILEGDFLEMEISDILQDSYKIIANIPYYITGAIIRKALEDTIKPSRAIFLVQKEVADRITRKEEGGSGKAGRIKSNILAESVAAYGTAEYLFTVVRGNFVPMPKVDSAAICISDISNKRFDESGVSEKAFFEVMKAGFAHKRKKLSSNLKEFLLKKDPSADAALTTETVTAKLDAIFADENINPDARAEEINTEMWFKIAKRLQSML